MKLLPGLAGLTLLLLASGVPAALLASHKQQGNETIYDYRWSDSSKHEQQLTFSISNDVEAPLQYRSYRPEMADAELRQALLKSAASFPPEVQLVMRGAPSEGRYQLRGGSPEQQRAAHDTLAKVTQTTRDAFLKGHNQALISLPGGESGVIPDHLYYINSSLPALAPMASQLRQRFPGADPRPLVDFLLPWLQSIPYDTMTNRFANPIADYRPPLVVLSQHRGDCDGKAALLGAILRATYPTLPLAMVYLPEHAMLAIHLPHASGERYVNLNGRRMLLADVAGPAMLPMGVLSERSDSLIASGQYALREIPITQKR